ncbi:MAG TPA: DUF2304 domain-containing protein [Gemmataceae bacterium]|jgi:hypothetical protein|nr:DUF2304 domain-containing protein [Gemmataceae bacterium]
MINAEFLMLLGGCGAFAMTLYWVRVRELRERYAIGWLAVATLLLLTGLFPDVLKGIADRAHLSYPALVLFAALGLIYLNSFFVSVALTKHYRWNVRLTQQMALLEERLRRLEEAKTAKPEDAEATLAD